MQRWIGQSFRRNNSVYAYFPLGNRYILMTVCGWFLHNQQPAINLKMTMNKNSSGCNNTGSQKSRSWLHGKKIVKLCCSSLVIIIILSSICHFKFCKQKIFCFSVGQWRYRPLYCSPIKQNYKKKNEIIRRSFKKLSRFLRHIPWKTLMVAIFRHSTFGCVWSSSTIC